MSTFLTVFGIVLGLLVLLGLGVWSMRLRPRESTYVPPELPRTRESEPSRTKAQELSELGILAIRPKERGADESDVASPATASASPPEQGPIDFGTVDLDTGAAPDYGDPGRDRPAAPGASSTRSPEGRPAPDSDPAAGTAVEVTAANRLSDVLIPFLKAVRAAVNAQTACLLRQDKLARQYRIEAIVSRSPHARPSGSFSTSVPLLNEFMAEDPLTVWTVGLRGLPVEALGYYRSPSPVRRVGVVLLPEPPTPEVAFLLVDTFDEQVLDTPRVRQLLVQFAETLGGVLAAHDRVPVDAAVRPRREIVAEEIEKARSGNRPLALGLIYLNRAEAISREGEAAVATAEEILEARLRTARPGARIERFGELTYGIFFHLPVGEVEAWALHLQEDLARESGALAGGVSIGIAFLQRHHTSPDELRADATEALREAFETGVCTIIE